MTQSPPTRDFDAASPMPVAEYAQTVTRVNVGYDLTLTLTGCLLRALDVPQLELLVVGAGGGAEIARFLPSNSGWRLTGVDPSVDMLALAEAAVTGLGLEDRVHLVHGMVADLPAGPHFDAATCLYVLHFLPDDGKLALLRGIAARLRPSAPLLVARGALPDDGGLREDLLGAWQQYWEAMGMPAEQMAQTINQIVHQPMPTEAEYRELLRAAGFACVTRYVEVLGGGLTAWVAR
jgi:tRNA (cmo5U34)-methyltransferase